MKVGLFVTNQQQLATDMVAALDDQIAMVELARDSSIRVSMPKSVNCHGAKSRFSNFPGGVTLAETDKLAAVPRMGAAEWAHHSFFLVSIHTLG